MESLKALAKPLFFLVMSAVAIWTFVVPDAVGFAHPAYARVFFWHLPCSILLLGFLFTAMYFSMRVFRRLDLQPSDSPRERAEWDIRAESALELGFIWASLTMATGILFSRLEWGDWWQWDYRQTSFLIALLMYGAYFAVRNSISDNERRAHYAAAYILSAALPIVFLVLVFPRIPLIADKSFHPTSTIMQGQVKGEYGYVTWSMVALMTILSVWLYQMRTRASLLAIGLGYKNGTMEIPRGGAAPTGVVRPVAVPGPDKPAT